MTLALKPEDYLRFIHFDGFTADWKDLRLRDDDLRMLQLQICTAPLAAPVIPGTPDPVESPRRIRDRGPAAGPGSRTSLP